MVCLRWQALSSTNRPCSRTVTAVIRCQAAPAVARPAPTKHEAASAEVGTLKIGFLGAGAVNFGKPDRPWNHAVRLEKIPGIQVTAVVDPNTEGTEQRLADFRNGAHPEKWENVQVFSSYQEMLQNEDAKPDAIFMGIPPEFHGSIYDENARAELDLAEAGIHMFVEKPVSSKEPDEVAELSEKLTKLQEEKNLVISVGYMLRYAAAIEEAKKLLEENDTPVAMVVGRYASTYTNTTKRTWWDITCSGGAIVEQATHFVDVMRYLGGEIVRDSILALAVGPEYPLTRMPDHPLAETTVPLENRPNRATAAMWRFESGALGSLNHTCIQHESQYYSTLEVAADGLQILINDPYTNPTLLVRRQMSDQYEEVPLNLEKDMYTSELEEFVDAVRSGDSSKLRTPYQDCALTYQATKWITDASMKNRTFSS